MPHLKKKKNNTLVGEGARESLLEGDDWVEWVCNSIMVEIDSTVPMYTSVVGMGECAKNTPPILKK